MPEADWQKIREVFDAALRQEPAARLTYISQTCGSDEYLRAEVESLLFSFRESDDFLETPAITQVADLSGPNSKTLSTGTQFAHYEIVSQIGAGGMGEVYLAKDQRLDRRVALKILNQKLSRDGSNLERFMGEAKAASALNHPNILVIHEIGESEGVHFIISEFIEGRTLRELLTESQLSLAKVLAIAIQIAEALAAAHGARLVHRDIKPENVMVRPDGYVKVLDFGLAKLVEQERNPLGVWEDTPSRNQTGQGVILGTVNYMSPEQAKGAAVDERADIFSLGVVIYEMVAGRTPFAADSPVESLANLINTEPPPLSRYVANAPEELQRTIIEMLRKNRDERYQTMTSLLTDLKGLQKNLTLDEILQKSEAENGSATSALPATRDGSSLQSAIPQHSLSQRIKNHKPVAIWAFVLTGLIVAVGLIFGLSKLVLRNRSSTNPATPFQTIELIRLTGTGRVRDAAISLDGRHLSYVAESGGKESIWLKDVTTSHNVEIVPPADVEHYGETFSPDGTYVYYLTKERNNTIAALNRVPVLGGVPAKLIVDVDGPISFSPDGTQLAFVRGSSTGERALMLANADGSDERKLVTRTGNHAFSFGGPAWSPDGKSIASGVAITDPTERLWSVVAVNVGDGSLKPLTGQKWKSIGRIWWLKDGNGMVFSATGLERTSTSQLWYLSYPSAEVQRITRDLQDYHGVSVTSDSKTLISKQGQTSSSLWIAPNGDADRAIKILSHKEDDAYYYFYRTRFSWTPNGQIIYSAIVNGTPSIWTMNAEGTGNKQLSSNPSDNGFPSMTTDGRRIIFVSDRAGFPNVWRMDSDGSNERQLTNGEDESWAWISPDNRWIVYHSGKLGQRTLWRVPIEGGKPEQLTNYPSICPVVSPDGKWISSYYRPETKAPWKLAIIPFDGGPPLRTFDVPQNVVFQSLVRWTPDGNSLAYIMNRDGISNIWIQPLDGRPSEQLTHFKADQIFWFDWSPDTRQLGVSRGAVTSDVVLIKDLR